jgi:hypothetical protein
MLKDLIKEFNEFFGGLAVAVIVNGRLEITIGSRTAVFSLPEMPKLVGGHNDPMA